ncbi:hypothetical protein CYMTET_31874, partial [Cymbomonas tetramitiformis]
WKSSLSGGGLQKIAKSRPWEVDAEGGVQASRVWKTGAEQSGRDQVEVEHVEVEGAEEEVEEADSEEVEKAEIEEGARMAGSTLVQYSREKTLRVPGLTAAKASYDANYDVDIHEKKQWKAAPPRPSENPGKQAKLIRKPGTGAALGLSDLGPKATARMSPAGPPGWRKVVRTLRKPLAEAEVGEGEEDEGGQFEEKEPFVRPKRQYARSKSKVSGAPLERRLLAALVGQGERLDDRGSVSGLMARIRIDTSFVLTMDMPTLFAGADAFVLPSHGEGWGLPLMEAMAMELPTIGTAFGGAQDFMHSKNSFPIKIQRLKEGTSGGRWAQPHQVHLKELMELVHRDSSSAKRIGQAARAELKLRYGGQAGVEEPLSRLRAIASKLT